MMRADPSGERSLLICNFSEHAQPIAIRSDRRHWELALWTADPTYGGNSGTTRPPNLIAADDPTTGIPVRLLHRALSLSVCWSERRPNPRGHILARALFAWLCGCLPNFLAQYPAAKFRYFVIIPERPSANSFPGEEYHTQGRYS